MSVKNKIGPIVEGSDFFGRVEEIENAWDLLANGNSLILAAPRRVGKSSFSKKMIKIAKENGWNIVDINLEGIDNEVDFIDTFIFQLEKNKWYFIQAIFKNVIDIYLEKKNLSIATIDKAYRELINSRYLTHGKND